MAIQYDLLLLETGSCLLLEDDGEIIIAEREVADESTGSGGGWPWPQKLVNILLPQRVLIDDEDVLFIIDD